MRQERPRLRNVQLLEPMLCKTCRFAQVVNVEMQDGTQRRMLQCRRGDCDNWGYTEIDQTPLRILSGDRHSSE